jgi:hypothetical protein
MRTATDTYSDTRCCRCPWHNPFRANDTESTKPAERAAVDQSTKHAERAIAKESASHLERAISNESATEVERANTPPLTEGYVVKGGHNQWPSQITKRPPPPAPMVKAK